MYSLKGSLPRLGSKLKRMPLQAWQPKEGGLLATGGEDGKVLIYNVLDTIEGVPYMCVPCASAELPEEGVTQIAWGSDNQLYTGHTSGTSSLVQVYKGS